MEANKNRGDRLSLDVVCFQVIHQIFDALFQCAETLTHQVLSDGFKLAGLDKLGSGWIELTHCSMHLAFLTVKVAEFE